MPAVSSVSPSGIAYVDYVDSGTKWTVNDFTYSFPTSASFYVGFSGGAYGSGEQNSGFKAFTAIQQSATASILNMYSAVANVTFTQITESSTQSATLRYAESNLPSTAWGYYPSIAPEGGDAWFNNSSHWYDNLVLGNYAYLTIIHETGHLLGLKHPHEASGSFGATPVSADSLEYTVMSYRSYIGASTTQGFTNGSWSFPQTLMVYDIAALQYMYGANYNTNSSDTVYKWNPATGQETINGVAQAAPGGNTIFQTVWDGGGSDTYDFSNYITSVTVSLQPGSWTTVSSAQLANLGAGHTAIGNIANAYLFNNNPASLIENAVGGTGGDLITGNIANNKLTGGAGADTLDGVSGTDTAVYLGASTSYQVTQNADGSWKVVDLRAGSPDGTDTLKNIDFLQFSDTTVAVGAVPPPPPPVVQAPVISSFSPDTASVGDGITGASVLTLAGTAPANSTVKIYDSGALLGSVTANGSGTWTYGTGSLAGGVHSFTATAMVSGSTSTASAALNVIIDTTAPVAPMFTSFSPDTGKAGDAITKSNTLAITGLAEANSVVKIYDGAILLGTATANSSGSWSYATPQLADGLQILTATASDAAGNTSLVSSPLGVIIDATAPVAPVITAYTTVNNIATLGGTAEANATVKIYDGTTLLNSMLANSSGIWSYTTSPLAGSTHVFTATATDTAGNTSVSSQVADPTSGTPVVIESKGVTSLVELGNHFYLHDSSGTGPSLKYFGADFTAGQFGAWTPIGAEQTATGYEVAWKKTGSDLYTVWSTDAQGDRITNLIGELPGSNSSLQSFETSFLQDFNNDGTIGAAPAIQAPVIGSFSPDTATVGDGITNASVLTLSGTAQANSTVTIYDSGALLGSVTANGSGTWIYVTGMLAGGVHSFTATATAAGSTSTASAALNVTIDTTAPVAPAITSFSTDSGTAGDNITSDNTLALIGTAEANATVKIYDGATLLGSAVANGLGAWSFTTGALANGVHSVAATATDTAGNVSATSVALSVTIDTTAPVAPAITSFSIDSGTAGDNITSDNTLALIGTAEANAMVKIYDGATLLGSAVANGLGAWSFTTGALANGVHSLTATASDAAGNTGVTSSALTVTIDATPPAAPIIASFSTDSGVVGDKITNDSTLTLSGTAEANSTVKLYDGATLLGSTLINGSGAWSFVTAALTGGNHSFTATAIDASGNTSTASAALNVIIDTTAPVAPMFTSFSPDTGKAGDAITKSNTLAITGLAEANSVVKIYDGAILLGTATANSSGSWSYATPQLADGLQILTATASDAAGNTSLVSSPLGVIIDATAPVAPVITAYTTVNNIATLGGTAEANATVKIYDGTTLLNSMLANSSGIWSYTTSPLAGSTHVFTATATDTAGNTSVSSQVADPTSGTPVVIESKGVTSLVELGNHFYLHDSSGTGPSLKYFGADFTAGQFGAWTPIGAEQTATGYEVAWKKTGSDLYTVWSTDAQGDRITNLIGELPGSNSSLQSFETSFLQDFNNDGRIGPAAAPAVNNIVSGTAASDTLSGSIANEIFYGKGGNNAFVFAGNFGKDIIADFQPGLDVIRLEQSAFADVAGVLAHAAQVEGDVVLTVDATNSITLNHTTLAQLNSHSFHLV